MNAIEKQREAIQNLAREEWPADDALYGIEATYKGERGYVVVVGDRPGLVMNLSSATLKRDRADVEALRDRVEALQDRAERWDRLTNISVFVTAESAL